MATRTRSKTSTVSAPAKTAPENLSDAERREATAALLRKAGADDHVPAQTTAQTKAATRAQQRKMAQEEARLQADIDAKLRVEPLVDPIKIAPGHKPTLHELNVQSRQQHYLLRDRAREAANAAGKAAYEVLAEKKDGVNRAVPDRFRTIHAAQRSAAELAAQRATVEEQVKQGS